MLTRMCYERLMRHWLRRRRDQSLTLIDRFAHAYAREPEHRTSPDARYARDPGLEAAEDGRQDRQEPAREHRSQLLDRGNFERDEDRNQQLGELQDQGRVHGSLPQVG